MKKEKKKTLFLPPFSREKKRERERKRVLSIFPKKKGTRSVGLGGKKEDEPKA